MRAELDAVGLDFANRREAEDLEAAAVGQDRSGPIDELMQSASGADDLEAGPDVEVISIAEDDLRAHLAQLARIDRLDAALGPDRHENGSVDDSVRRGQPAQAGFGIRVGFEQFEHAENRYSFAAPNST